MRELTGPRAPRLWLLSELPIREIPREFQADLARARRLLVVEEHVLQGGGGSEPGDSVAVPPVMPPSGFPPGLPKAICRDGTARRAFTVASAGIDPASILEFLDQGAA